MTKVNLKIKQGISIRLGRWKLINLIFNQIDKFKKINIFLYLNNELRNIIDSSSIAWGKSVLKSELQVSPRVQVPRAYDCKRRVDDL